MSQKLLEFFVFFAVIFDLGSTQTVTVVDETQSSVASEKFPLLRIVTAFISDNWNLRITNLGNFGSSSFLSRFQGAKTVLYIHAWLEPITEYANGAATIGLRNSFEEIYSGNFAGTKHNLITVNWTAYNKADYLTVIHFVQPIANEIGDQLFNMVSSSNNPIDLSKWQFLGYSLGAHIAGLVARRIRFRSNGGFLVPRITALEAAGPVFNYPVLSWFFPHLEKSDGELLEFMEIPVISCLF